MQKLFIFSSLCLLIFHSALAIRHGSRLRHGNGTSTTQAAETRVEAGTAFKRQLQDADPCASKIELTAETWKAWLGPSWLEEQLTLFREEFGYDYTKSFVADWLVPKYFPHASPTQAPCNGVDYCSFASCQNVANDIDGLTKLQAYFTMESISNFNNYLALIYKAAQDAASTIQSRGLSLERDFSDPSEEAKAVADDQNKQRLILSANLAVTLVAAAAIPALGPILDGGLALNAAVNAIPGTIAGAQAGGIGIDWAHESEGGLPGFFFKVQLNFARAVEGPGRDILNGWQDTNGNDLASILRDGNFAKAPDISSTQLTNLLEEYWHGVAINYLWRESRAYIIMSNTDNCTADAKGPSWTKICLDDVRDKVFYAYYLNKASETKNLIAGYANPLPLPGYDLLKPGSDYHVTLDKAVLSSYRYYLRFQHEGIETVNPADLGFDDFDPFSEDFSTVGAGHRGIFTIPICRDDVGRFISSVGTDEALNYPCICGASDGGHKDTWNWADDESAGFLEATNLRYSVDLPTCCEVHLGCDVEDQSSHIHELKDRWRHDEYSERMLEHTKDWRGGARHQLDAAYTECIHWQWHDAMGSRKAKIDKF